MVEWLQIPEDRRAEILKNISAKEGLPVKAVEKDWWVTLTLKALFATKHADSLVFKGGTSLSKSWNLIERFSEDIDLGLDRASIGYSGDLSKNKIEELRGTAFAFISNELKTEIEQTLVDMGVPEDSFKIIAAPSATNKDPQTLQLEYKSLIEDTTGYIASRVLIEVSARSLREPFSARNIQSLIGANTTPEVYSEMPFSVNTVEPKRTFLEKAFLLHEEFSKPLDKIRHDRLSRHLYDLHRIMDTVHGTEALRDMALYNSIIEHREKFNKIAGIDYAKHSPDHISFIPPDGVLKNWENDYIAMTETMIYGDAPDFKTLIQRMYELLNRFRQVNNPEVKIKVKE